MIFRLLADAVIVLHFAFVVFVVFGGFLACWRRWVWWIHLAAVAYGAGIVFVGWSCPLTDLERALRDAGGETASPEGFVERFLEGLIYPGDLTPLMRVFASCSIVVSWAVLVRRRNVETDPPPFADAPVRGRSSSRTDVVDPAMCCVPVVWKLREDVPSSVELRWRPVGVIRLLPRHLGTRSA